jgi:integrase
MATPGRRPSAIYGSTTWAGLTLKKKWAPQLAAATINRRLAWLSAVLNYIIDEGWDIKNAVQQEGLVRGFDNRRKRELHPEEEQALRAAWDRLGCPEREFWKVEFAIHTSVRQSEQFNMTWENVDFRNEIITFPHTKPGRIKEIYMNKRARAILEQLHADRQPGIPSVWVGPRGGQLQVRNWMWQYWEPALKETTCSTCAGTIAVLRPRVLDALERRWTPCKKCLVTRTSAWSKGTQTSGRRSGGAQWPGSTSQLHSRDAGRPAYR